MPSHRPLSLCCVALACFLLPNPLRAAPAPPTSRPVGRITVAFGAIRVESEKQQRPVGVASAVYAGERLVVAAQSAATLLLDSRVVVNVGADSLIRLVERRGRTEVQLERGQAEIFVGHRPPELGPVALVDPEVTIETNGTVFLATYSPSDRAGTYACEENSMTLTTHGGQRTVVAAGKMARVRGGAIGGLEAFDRSLIHRPGSTLPRLRRQALLQGNQVAQQKQVVASLKDTFKSGLASRANSKEESTQLADLLAARCADLHNGINDVQGATVRASPGGNLVFYFRDFGVDGDDGDVIQYTARSCTASVLSDAKEHVIAGQKVPLYGAQFITLPVGVVDEPNIVEITVKGIDAGTVRPKIAVQIGFEGFISEPPGTEVLRRRKIEEGDVFAYQVVVVPEDTPLPETAAAKVANSPPQPRTTLASAAYGPQARAALPAAGISLRQAAFKVVPMGPAKPR